MTLELRQIQAVMAGTNQSLEAAVKLLAAGASQVLKQAGIVGAEQKVSHLLYASVVEIVKVVEAAERAKARDADRGQEAGG